jgi:type IV pilus assembly protein PilC
MLRHPKVFGELFTSMVRASEASGTMGKMLQRVSKYLEQQRAVRRRVKGAVAYPIAMLGFCIAVVVALLVFVLPRFEKIYANKQAALPMPTQLLLSLSKAMVNYWYLIILGLGLIVTGVYLFFRRPEGKVVLDAIRLRLPILGPMFRKSSLSRSLRTLATMIQTGVSVLDAIDITADVSGNHQFARAWRELAERLKNGSNLAEEMAKQPLIPRSVTQMVAAGDRTGKLGMVLERVSDFCEEELDTAVRTATSFVEPAMIIIMGGVVGGIAMALLLPVFSLSKVMSH